MRPLLEWLPTALRVVVVGLTLPPAAGKVLDYGGAVAQFTRLGIPVPEAAVLLVGGVQVAALVLLVLDRYRRAAAASLVPVMVVALLTAGEWQALAVLLAALGLLVVDPGPLEIGS